MRIAPVIVQVVKGNELLYSGVATCLEALTERLATASSLVAELNYPNYQSGEARLVVL